MNASNSSSGASGFLFRPTAPLENIRRRATLNRIIRAFFDEHGFIEVATPTLSRDAVVDRYVEPIPVEIEKCWQERDDFFNRRFRNSEPTQKKSEVFYLQTSPEFAMKRLLAAGLESIYQITPAYRRGDFGRFHNIEFTMLEWYRSRMNYEEGRAFLAELIQMVSSRFYDSIDEEARPCFQSAVEERSFSDVFIEKTGIHPCKTDSGELHKFAVAKGIAFPDSYCAQTQEEDWIDLIFSEMIQPELGQKAPVIVYDYPGGQSQLAQTAAVDDAIVARRYELFVNGIELANGYDELLDPNVLRKRIAQIAEQRKQDGSPTLPVESRLLAAMDSGLPPSSGCALGIERFLMTLLNAKTLAETISFPTDVA